MHDVAIVGGGIVGVATAVAVTDRFPGADVVLLEKEPELARHQSGRNSGVIHSGIYYRPGTLKAELATSARRTMADFCAEHDIPHAICGKLIVATAPEQLAGLDTLLERGLANGLPVRRLTPSEVADREPHVRCLAAIDVPTTGIVDYRAVTRRLARLAEHAGVTFRLGTTVQRIEHTTTAWRLRTDHGEVEARRLVTCGGLQSDRLATKAGARPPARIVPFRGEYYDLVEHRADLVKGLVYPVPDLRFPFLGVHVTRGIDGRVHAGPNAVLALAREGYRWRDISPTDLAEVLRYPGFWRMARRHARYGVGEIVRSLSKERFVRSARQLVPDVRADDFVPAPAGVRAQAVDHRGNLLDDFLILAEDGALHVLNAPSPAATASIEIGRRIAEQLMLARP